MNKVFAELLPKTGEEVFHANRASLNYSIKDFWTWNGSDLISHVARGYLAEFIVARAIGATENVHDEWAMHDLTTWNGIKITVKSTLYLRGSPQAHHRPVHFNVAKTKELDLKSGRYYGKARRYADVYIFALLAHKDKPTVDPLNVKQWEFYVLPTSVLDQRQRSDHSITLKTVIDLSGGTVDYFHLADQINAVHGRPQFCRVQNSTLVGQFDGSQARSVADPG